MQSVFWATPSWKFTSFYEKTVLLHVKVNNFYARVWVSISRQYKFLAEWLSILSLQPQHSRECYSSDFCSVSCLVSIVISSIGFGGGVDAMV